MAASFFTQVMRHPLMENHCSRRCYWPIRVIEAMGMQSFVKICCIVSTPGSRGELPEIRLMISLEVGAERNAHYFPTFLGITSGLPTIRSGCKIVF
jgi:hypothetical protein